MLDEDERVRIHRSTLLAVQDGGWQATMAVRLCMLGSSVAVLPRNLDNHPTERELEALAAVFVSGGTPASSRPLRRSVVLIEAGEVNRAGIQHQDTRQEEVL